MIPNDLPRIALMRQDRGRHTVALDHVAVAQRDPIAVGLVRKGDVADAAMRAIALHANRIVVFTSVLPSKPEPDTKHVIGHAGIVAS